MQLLQAASNSAASNVSAPVDLLSMAMRKFGVPVGNAPIGGSEWMRRNGLTKEVANPYLNAAGETFGLVAPLGVAAKAPQIAAGINQAMTNAAIPNIMNPQRGAIVYHGGPHKFDKFDASKIGSGEGAQAYGHGLYLADSPDVAATYLSSNNKLSTAEYALKNAGGSVSIARKNLLSKYPKERKNYKLSQTGDPELAALFGDPRKEIVEGLQQLRNASLYKADLDDAAIARMLDWDKPLSQQAPEVQNAVAALAPKNRSGQPMIGLDATGAEIASVLGMSDGGSSILRKAGIPGIRYLEGGYRGAGGGTSNYVVFPGEENAILKILQRNGIDVP